MSFIKSLMCFTIIGLSFGIDQEFYFSIFDDRKPDSKMPIYVDSPYGGLSSDSVLSDSSTIFTVLLSEGDLYNGDIDHLENLYQEIPVVSIERNFLDF